MTGLVSDTAVLTGDTGDVTEFVGWLRGLLSHLSHSALSPSSFPTPVLKRTGTALGHRGLVLSLLICSSPGCSISPATHRPPCSGECDSEMLKPRTAELQDSKTVACSSSTPTASRSARNPLLQLTNPCSRSTKCLLGQAHPQACCAPPSPPAQWHPAVFPACIAHAQLWC